MKTLGTETEEEKTPFEYFDNWMRKMFTSCLKISMPRTTWPLFLFNHQIVPISTLWSHDSCPPTKRKDPDLVTQLYWWPHTGVEYRHSCDYPLPISSCLCSRCSVPLFYDVIIYLASDLDSCVCESFTGSLSSSQDRHHFEDLLHGSLCIIQTVFQLALVSKLSSSLSPFLIVFLHWGLCESESLRDSAVSKRLVT